MNERSLLEGWDKAWIDGITERIYKKEFETSVSRVEEVVRTFYFPYRHCC